eukprot:1094792-Amorphochlora_amoeboformis.AAC.1
MNPPFHHSSRQHPYPQPPLSPQSPLPPARQRGQTASPAELQLEVGIGERGWVWDGNDGQRGWRM